MYIEARFYETYELCAVVDAVLTNRFDHLIKLDEQAEAVDMAERKRVEAAFADIPAALDDLKPEKLPMEAAFDRYGIGYQSFGEFLRGSGRRFKDADEDDIYEFMNGIRLSEAYEKLLDQTVKEVFHVLFQNRSLLLGMT